MSQPKGFEVAGQEDKVCFLLKSLYGLKQSPRQLNIRFDTHMVTYGFVRNQHDTCVYFKQYAEGKFVYLLLYVDDILLICKDKRIIRETKEMLKQEFEIRDLGDAKKILGIEIKRNRDKGLIKLQQTAYIDKVLAAFRMESSKVVSTPMASHFRLSALHSPSAEEERVYMSKVPYANLVGSLMYLMVCTRPDLHMLLV